MLRSLGGACALSGFGHVVQYHVAGAAPPRPGAGGEAGG